MRASTTMESRIDFLRSQVNKAVMQHEAFLRSVVDHEATAQDQRFRDLCSRHIPRMREHQRMLEECQRTITIDIARGETNPLDDLGGTLRRVAGRALGMAKEVAHARGQ